MLDVEAVELDAASPGVAAVGVGLEEVADLVVVDVEGEDGVRGLGHDLLAEVRSNEASSSDHADRHRFDRSSIEVHSRRCRHFFFFFL